MNGKALREASAAIVLVTCLGTATAHHSNAMFDQTRQLTLDGVVRRVDWVNPHVYIHMADASTSAEDVTWVVEAGPPNVMSRNGWSSDSLQVGDRVIVTAHPARNPRNTTVLGKSIVKGDDLSLGIEDSSRPDRLRTPDASETFFADSLDGVWLTDFDSAAVRRFVQPAGSWSLTEAGAQAVATYSGEVNPGQDCVQQTVPFVMVWPALHRIEIGEDVAVIRSEWGERTIHVNRDSHDGALFGHQGHSIGRWDGNALVVDTTHFADHRSGHGGGLASGPRKHLIERFELSPGRNQLTYLYEVEDPDYLLEPMTGSLTLTYRPDLSLVVVPCDLEAARRYLAEAE